MVSNAAGFLELIFLVLVFAIYLLLARRPGQGLRKGMAGRIEARIKNYLSVKMMLSVVVLAPIPHTAQRAPTPLCESNERAERATTTTRDDELPDPTVRHRRAIISTDLLVHGASGLCGGIVVDGRGGR